MSQKHYSSVVATDIECGQRPYGPTVYEARLIFRRTSPFVGEGEVPRYVNADEAKRAFRLLCQDNWKDADEPITDWFETRLTKCERDEPTPWLRRDGSCGVPDIEFSDSWVIRVERPYDD